MGLGRYMTLLSLFRVLSMAVIMYQVEIPEGWTGISLGRGGWMGMSSVFLRPIEATDED